MNQPLTHFRTTSHEQERIHDPLRELALLTSYNKTHTLDVPVFMAENKNKRLPLREQVVKGFLLQTKTNSEAAKSLTLLANALVLAVGVDVRYEPMNDTAIHRSYPSPRGLFPVDVYVVFATDGQEIRFAYDKTHHALLHDPAVVLCEGVAEWEVRIQLVASLNKIAPLYGDLAVSLCALEIGHLSHQTCAALQSVGLSFECRMLEVPSAATSLSGAEHIVPLVEIALGRKTYILPSAKDFADTLRIPAYALNEANWREVARVRAWMASTGGSSRLIESVGEDCDFPPIQTGVSCHRSAGNITTGTYGRVATPDELDALVASILQDYRASSHPLSARPELTILRTSPDFAVTVIHAGGASAGERVVNGCVPLSDAFGTFYNIDMQTIPLVVAFTADFGVLMKKDSSWAYLEMLVLAGISSQRICNEAATRGFVARPFKGMREHILETAFNLEGQCFYTILLGKSAERNPALSVSSLRACARNDVSWEG